VAEWFKALVLKTSRGFRSLAGSNPTPSAKIIVIMMNLELSGKSPKPSPIRLAAAPLAHRVWIAARRKFAAQPPRLVLGQLNESRVTDHAGRHAKRSTSSTDHAAALIHVERALLAFGASAHCFNSPVSGPR
jgi:hypothetical protein